MISLAGDCKDCVRTVQLSCKGGCSCISVLASWVTNSWSGQQVHHQVLAACVGGNHSCSLPHHSSSGKACSGPQARTGSRDSPSSSSNTRGERRSKGDAQQEPSPTHLQHTLECHRVGYVPHLARLPPAVDFGWRKSWWRDSPWRVSASRTPINHISRVRGGTRLYGPTIREPARTEGDQAGSSGARETEDLGGVVRAWRGSVLRRGRTGAVRKAYTARTRVKHVCTTPVLRTAGARTVRCTHSTGVLPLTYYP